MEYTISKIADIFSEVFDIDPKIVTEDTSIEDIEKWDSISHLNMILMIEDEFGIRINPKDFNKLTSVKNIIEEIKKARGRND